MFDKKATKGIEFAFFETPSFTQNASARVSCLIKRPPYRTDKQGVIYEDAESRTEDGV